MQSDLIDLTLAPHPTPSKLAILVSETGDAKKGKWLPLSKIEVEDKGTTMRGEDSNGRVVNLQVVEVTLPEWLAVEKGLV